MGISQSILSHEKYNLSNLGSKDILKNHCKACVSIGPFKKHCHHSNFSLLRTFDKDSATFCLEEGKVTIFMTASLSYWEDFNVCLNIFLFPGGFCPLSYQDDFIMTYEN